LLDEVGARVVVDADPLLEGRRCMLGTPAKHFPLLDPPTKALLALGFSPSAIELFVAEEVALRLDVFRVPQKRWAPSTWFNMIGCVCRAYHGPMEVGSRLQPLAFDLLRMSEEEAERALGVTFDRVLREGPAGEHWMSLARFRALPAARAAHARLFLCCAEGIGPGYCGDGFVGRADGGRGAPEIIGPALDLHLLASHVFHLSVEPQQRPARRQYTARRASGGRP
jgi:hypothetical protein